MRIWYYKYIPFLPQAQLLGQWRECIAVAHDWAEGKLKHAIVNRVMDYSPLELLYFSKLVADELANRKIYVTDYTVAKLKDYIFQIHAHRYKDSELPYEMEYFRKFIDDVWSGKMMDENDKIFFWWHNEDYARECYFNLEEKYHCGCIPENEWQRFLEGGLKYV